MAAHITWNGHAIGGLESGAINVYSALSYSIETKTKAQDGDGVLYVQQQGYNAAQFQVTIHPSAALGQDVEEVITSFKNDSRSGVCARILLGGRDLFGADFLLTGVSVSNVKFYAKTGKMVSAEIKLTWQESDGQTYDDAGISADTTEIQTTKGNGSKYLKDAKNKDEKSDETANDVDAISGADGKSSSGGNLTGFAGRYDPKGIIEKAKKLLLPSQNTKKDSTVRRNKNLTAL